MKEMKYEDLPEDYAETLIVPPIYVRLPNIDGARFKWKSIEEIKEYDSSLRDYAIHKSILTLGWAPVSSNLFPKLPSVKDTIEWRGLVLCSTSLPDVDLFVANNEKEVLDVVMKRIEFANSLSNLVTKACIENRDSLVVRLKADPFFLGEVVDGLQRTVINGVYRKTKENTFWARLVRAFRRFRRSLSG